MDDSSTAPPGEWNVGRYLGIRLEQLGVRHLFGVPGNHLGPFLSTLQQRTTVEWVGTPTENGAGQAADAYARVHGIGAAAVTYSVGAFNLLNAVGGAYVEFLPLVAINASPTYEQWLNYDSVKILASHMLQRPESNLEVYRQVTVDAQVISNAALAPGQIDTALTACLSQRRPVYLEVMEDVWDAPCPAPTGTLEALERPQTARQLTLLTEAVAATLELIAAHQGPHSLPRPVLLVGEEVERFGAERELTELLERTGLPYCTTVGAKSVLPEDRPEFHGVYNGKSSLPEVRTFFKETATCRIGLGNWATSHNLGGERTMGTDWVVAAREGVSVGTTHYPDVRLVDYLTALREALIQTWGERAFAADYFALAAASGKEVPGSVAEYRERLTTAPGSAPPVDEPLTIDGIFRDVNAFLARGQHGEEEYTVVSDAGFGLLGSMNLHMARRRSYLAQNSWLSIGYAMGATTGLALADRVTRPLVFIGDGAFQETCQELSTHTRHGLRPVVFVMDNESFYGIEQMLVHPAYYRHPEASDGADHYNILHPWNYERLAEVFTSPKTPVTGVQAATRGELGELLGRLADPTDVLNGGPALIRLRISRHDYPRALSHLVNGA